MGYMLFRQSAAIDTLPLIHSIRQYPMEHLLFQPMHQWQNQFPYKQAQAKLTGVLYAFRQFIPINLVADPVHPTVPNSTLTGPSNETGKIISTSKQLSAYPASVHIV